jgi:hypothetical protein
MRGSQSISDLSNIHDNTFSGGHLQDRPNSSAAHGPRGNKVKQALTVDHSPITGSKRNQACTTSKNVSASSTVNNGTLPITNHYVVCAVAGSEPRLTIFFPHMSLVWCLVNCMINYISCRMVTLINILLTYSIAYKDAIKWVLTCTVVVLL